MMIISVVCVVEERRVLKANDFEFNRTFKYVVSVQ